MTVWSEQFSPKADLEYDGPNHVRYAICSTQRSGSHFLGRLLKETGLCGDPLEYFNPQNLEVWKERMQADGASEILPYLERIRSSSNGCFGMKIHFVQLAAMESELSLQSFLRDFRLIWIRREDVLGQAISYAKAKQTGAFISAVEEQNEAVYNAQLISECMAAVIAQNASWEMLFASCERPVLCLRYEDLSADSDHEVGKVAAHLGLELEIVQPVAEPSASGGLSTSGGLSPSGGLPPSRGLSIKRQADGRNREWRERYLADFGEEHLVSSQFDLTKVARRSFTKRVIGRLRRTLG